MNRPDDAAPIPGMPGTEPFLAASAMWLRDIYLPRIERAVAVLPPDDFWWRPHDATNAVGDLLLHLEGNVRQWILVELAGEPDTRQRDHEFDRTRAATPPPDICAAFRDTISAAATAIAQTPEHTLDALHTVQGFTVTRRNLILHVVEHLSWHAGQIAWITKARTGPRHNLAYFDDTRLTP